MTPIPEKMLRDATALQKLTAEHMANLNRGDRESARTARAVIRHLCGTLRSYTLQYRDHEESCHPL
jgi:hypothetical protein